MTRKNKKIGSQLNKVKKNLLTAIKKWFAENGSNPVNYKQVAAALKVSAEDEFTRLLIKENLEYLQDKGILASVSPGKYHYNTPLTNISGTVDMLASGNAYIKVPGLDEDIYIAQKFTNKALHGDEVRVQLHAKRKGKKPTGEVIEIIKRAKNTFVGIIERNENHAFFIPDSDKMPTDLFIPLSELNGAEHGMKVIAEITEWSGTRKNPVGRVIEVIGKPGENETEMHAILAEYGFPSKFPEHIETLANTIPNSPSESEIKKRRDMRNIPTLTIDPKDAKDFDDALSIHFLENGTIEVGVHIADVSHYMTENSELDKEAFKRATSVYLVDRVVPMLPEKLSNGVCSLRPKEEKLCFSAIFTLSKDAEILSEWFGKTVIYSNHRFTYEEAQEVIDSKKGTMAKEINTLHQLASILRKKRFKNGALKIEQTEVKFILDESGKPLDVYFKESKEANHLIEEFMLLANKKVASFVGEKKQKQDQIKSFVYRIHDSPNPEKLKEFKKFVAGFGYKLDLSNAKAISLSINKLLEDIKGKPEQSMIQTLAVRSMAKAIYSSKNVGHYGLAFDYYSHFTSPIRRYPDVMVHRLLEHYLNKGQSVSSEELESKCKHASEMEKKASDAERSSIKYKQVEFMKAKVGNEFKGIISGVTEWGIFVEIKENKCEGLIRLKELENDFFVFDEKNHCVRGTRKGKIYRLGDDVNIIVKRADLEKRQLDFKLANNESNT
jgi:ribonuclease R